MPTNKNASFRYRVLDQCFRNRAKEWSLEDLINKVSEELEEHFGYLEGIRQRQIQADINIMRSDPPRGFSAPIVCKNGCYYYSDHSYSIEKKALNDQDINNLNEALSLLRQFKGVPHFQDIERILLKMEGKIRYNDAAENIISFEQIDLIKGYEFIPMFYNAIREGKTLTIEYQSFLAANSSFLEVHPYYLKEYRGRWYAFSWVAEHRKITNLALDRIESIGHSTKKYRPNSEFDPVNYFKPIVGVTLPDNGTLQTIKIKVTPFSASYIRSKPIHHTQIEEKPYGDYSVFIYTLIPNFEFEAELLRLGEAVEVIRPNDFRLKMQQRLSTALLRYQTE
jgi:predicted DNA-binding transcriptional regulator YafY